LIIECKILASVECVSFQQPLRTPSDGNCLVHAASIALWGVPDHHLVLRRAIHAVLDPANAHMARSLRKLFDQQDDVIRRQGALLCPFKISMNITTLL
jgi:hypothetical protein